MEGFQHGRISGEKWTSIYALTNNGEKNNKSGTKHLSSRMWNKFTCLQSDENWDVEGRSCWLNFARKQLNRQETFSKSLFWTDESNNYLITFKTAIFAEKQKDCLSSKESPSKLKYGSRTFKRTTFSVSGHGRIHVTQGKMYSQSYQQSLERNPLPSIRELCPKMGAVRR